MAPNSTKSRSIPHSTKLRRLSTRIPRSSPVKAEIVHTVIRPAMIAGLDPVRHRQPESVAQPGIQLAGAEPQRGGDAEQDGEDRHHVDRLAHWPARALPE